MGFPLVLKFPQLWFLCQFVCAIAHNILDMLYRLCGFYCCVAPANLNYMPNLYGWPNNVLVVPLPRVGGGGSAIIEISGKEIKMKSFSCQ